MDKSLKTALITTGIITLLTIPIGHYIRQNILINEINKLSYDYLECVSDVPTIENEYGDLRFDLNWLSACPEPTLTPKYRNFLIRNEDKLLIYSYESNNCLDRYINTGNGEEYKVCLKEILPILKEKYNL